MMTDYFVCNISLTLPKCKVSEKILKPPHQMAIIFPKPAKIVIKSKRFSFCRCLSDKNYYLCRDFPTGKSKHHQIAAKHYQI